MNLRVIIACGGTGGHLFPGIAVAQRLRARGHEVLLLISEKKVDAVAAADHPELSFATVPSIGLPPLFSPRLFSFAWKMWKTLRLTKKRVREFKPDAVLGMGGFTSLAPAIAGRGFGARTFIHESNSIPGKANRLTARFCDVVLLGLADCSAYFPGRETRVVGTPLRASMLAEPNREASYQFFQLDPTKKTLLIMGGSQGARGVNQAMLAALPHLDPSAVQLLWLTGELDEAQVRAAVAKTSLTGFIAPFHGRLDLAYPIADVCVARSGGSSLAELAHFGVATILIPLPTAADDHQTRNAEAFAKRDAAILLPQAEAATRLPQLFEELLGNESRRLALVGNIKTLGMADAADRVADVIEETVKKA